MPYAVTHVLIAIIIADIIRDYFIKDKKKFPLHYVLIAGVAGLLPDIDVLFMILANYSISDALSTTINGATNMHPSFTHSILWIPIFLAIAFLFLWLEKRGDIKKIEMGLKRHRITVSGILFIIALGITVHLILDGILSGYIRIGFFTEPIGLNIIHTTKMGNMIAAGIDAVLLLSWLIHEELKHKISDFI